MKIIKGNLITLANAGEFDMIVHGCNCFNAMKSGIAKQIATAYPAAERADNKTARGDRYKLGTCTGAVVIKPNDTQWDTILYVVNAYTQYGTDPDPTVDLFEYDAFKKILDKLASDHPAKRYGFPKIGCGLAGGDEARILTMIDDFSKTIEGTVTVVEWG